MMLALMGTLWLGSVSGFVAKPDRRLVAARDMEMRAETLEEEALPTLSLPNLLGLHSAMGQPEPVGRDLEYRNTIVESRLYARIYSELQLTGGEQPKHRKVKLETLYQVLPVLEHLPPLRRIAAAWERWVIYSGAEETITPKVVQSAYKDLFNMDLPKSEAEQMVLNLMVPTPKLAASITPRIGRCEFILGTLKQTYFTPNLVAGLHEVWSSRPKWKIADLLLELGFEGDPQLNSLWEASFRIDRHPENTELFLSQCEAELVVATVRDSAFRSYFQNEEPRPYTPAEGRDLEAFQGVELFPHSLDDFVRSRELKSQKLANLFKMVDYDNNGWLNYQEFTDVLKTIDEWQDIAPTPAELGSEKVLTSFPGERVVDPPSFLKPNSRLKAAFDGIWNRLAGTKRLFMTPREWGKFNDRGAERGKFPSAYLKNTNEYNLARYKNVVSPKLLRPEVENALYGYPTPGVYLTLEDFKNVLDLLNPDSHELNRETWGLVSTLLHLFNRLDIDSTGKLSPKDFNSFGVTIMGRLGSKTALSTDQEKLALYEDLKARVKSSEFNFPCFAAAFLGTNSINLDSFLTTPLLDVARVK